MVYVNFDKIRTKRKLKAADKSIARARAVLGKRSMGIAPAATRGFYGISSFRGRNELKTIDTQTASVIASATTGNIILLSGVAVGTDYNTRIGRKVVIKSVYLRMAAYLTPAAPANEGDFIRCLLIVDKQANGAAPVISDIFQNSNYIDPLNLNNRDRFKVMYDKMIAFGPSNYAAAAITGGAPQPRFKKYFKLCNYETIFGGTGATVGSIQSNALYLVFLSKQGLTYVDYNCRVRFMDG